MGRKRAQAKAPAGVSPISDVYLGGALVRTEDFLNLRFARCARALRRGPGDCGGWETPPRARPPAGLGAGVTTHTLPEGTSGPQGGQGQAHGTRGADQGEARPGPPPPADPGPGRSAPPAAHLRPRAPREDGDSPPRPALPHRSDSSAPTRCGRPPPHSPHTGATAPGAGAGGGGGRGARLPGCMGSVRGGCGSGCGRRARARAADTRPGSRTHRPAPVHQPSAAFHWLCAPDSNQEPPISAPVGRGARPSEAAAGGASGSGRRGGRCPASWPSWAVAPGLGGGVAAGAGGEARGSSRASQPNFSEKEGPDFPRPEG